MKPVRSDRGATAVEFALVILPLALLLMGIIDFGRAYSQQLELSSAAREGARVMAVQNNSAQAISKTHVQAPDAQVSVVVRDKLGALVGSCNTAGVALTRLPYMATVTATYPLESLTGFFSSLLDGRTLTGTGVMQCGG